MDSTGLDHAEYEDNVSGKLSDDRFAKMSRRYEDEQKELAEKIDGVWEQRLRIHYNCVGTIEIPTVLPLPIPEVSVNTRKGVVVNYAPCELAV